MNMHGLRMVGLAAVLLCLGISPAHAQGFTFVIDVDRAWFKAAPSSVAANVMLAEAGKPFGLLARTPNREWVQLSTGAGALWLPAGAGNANTDLGAVPESKASYAPISPNPSRVAPPNWVQNTPRAKGLYQAAVKAGRDPRLFTVAGDSNAMWINTIGTVAMGFYDFGRNYYLRRAVVARFDPSFAHQSAAVHGGMRAADMFLLQSDYKPARCDPNEGMFVCELRQSNASIVFISLGTGDRFVWQDYEANMRKMIDTALGYRVLPILFTKADDLEQFQGGAPIDHMNNTVRKLAAEYQLPLIEFYTPTRSLPTVPNPKLPDRPFIKNGLHDEWGYYFHLTEEARMLKVLCMMQMLDAITR